MHDVALKARTSPGVPLGIKDPRKALYRSTNIHFANAVPGDHEREGPACISASGTSQSLYNAHSLRFSATTSE